MNTVRGCVTTLETEVFLCLPERIQEDQERERRPVIKLHTQSQNKEQRRTDGGLRLNILPIPH